MIEIYIFFAGSFCLHQWATWYVAETGFHLILSPNLLTFSVEILFTVSLASSASSNDRQPLVFVICVAFLFFEPPPLPTQREILLGIDQPVLCVVGMATFNSCDYYRIPRELR